MANAVQHGRSGVTLVASGEDQEAVVVTVRNSGDPIPPEQLAGVFDAFKKGDKDPNGLGLGLFIVREIALAHTGSVGVTSDADGTVFTFRLPRKAVAENRPPSEDRSRQEGDLLSLASSL